MSASRDPEDSDEEGYEEDPAQLIREFANHPLMKRAQQALLSQLKEKQAKLDAEIKEKNEDVKKINQEREAVGNQLYSNQQQLAKLQVALENAHNEYNAIVDAKIQEEELLKDIEKNNAEEKALVNEHSKQLKKYQQELTGLTETLRQVEKYNEDMKSEIAVTKRAAHKAEQGMQNLENFKANQDSFVDNLNTKVKQYKEQIAVVVAQQEIQKAEIAEAESVLQETVKELDLIANEKKHLMTQWKAALAGLSRRDEAMSQASQALANAEAAVHDFDVEIETAKRDIMNEQAKHEEIVNLRDKLESSLQFVEDNGAKMKAERDQLQERYALLSKSLAQTEADSKKLDLQSKQLGIEGEALLQNLMLVQRERHRVEVEDQQTKSSTSNVSKAVQNLLKEQEKLLKKIHEREIEESEVENEIARTRVDALNAGSTNDQLKDQLDTASKELKEKDSLVEKYQVEIRQRTDEIEKKMYRVDRLNKKYEKMVESAGGEENLGPMENIVRNLGREIEQIGNECKELEREWLKRQTELVQRSSEADKIQEENGELQARITILVQKKLRATKELNTIQSEVKAATQMDVELQKDITKLNALISENQTQEGELQNANYVLEMECVDELRSMEKASVTLRGEIAEVRAAKANILEQIMDTERQALLWEKKIQLDKETREALDPTVGQAENQTMEKEIHRMSLRHEALKREQERLASELERSVTKRMAIENRYGKTKSTLGATGTSTRSSSTGALDMTQASLKKRVSELKKDARELSEQTQKYTQSIEERRAALSEMSSELERVTSQYGETEEKNHEFQSQINDLLYQKQLGQERLAYRQKYVKRMKELSQNGVDNTQALQVERKLLSATQGLENVKEIIVDLQEHHPHLHEVLKRVLTMTDSGIDVVD